MHIPVLVGSEEIPVGAAQERAENDQQHPQDHEPEKKDRDFILTFFEREITVPLGIHIQELCRHQSDDDQTGKKDSRDPGS